MKKIAVVKKLVTIIGIASLLIGNIGGVSPSKNCAVAANIVTDKEKLISYNEETGMYEYSFYDAYIYDISISDYDITIDLIPSFGNDHFNYEYHKKILLNYSSATGEKAGLYERDNKKLAEMIMPNSRVNITFAAYREYNDLSYKGEGIIGWKSSRDYYVSRIVSVIDPDTHIYGDINDDGVIDTFDVIIYRKYITGNLLYKLDDDEFQNADIDMDTEITQEDLRQVSDYVLGSSKEFNVASNIGSIRLDNTVSASSKSGVKTDDAFAAAEMNFGVEMIKKCYSSEKGSKGNLLISPVSISSALSMIANGADSETLDEMEKVLGNGLTIDQINDYMTYYIQKLPDTNTEKAYLANSIWLKNDPSLSVYDSFLETNNKYYRAEIYKSIFDKSIVNDVNSWANKNTNGMIPRLIDSSNIKDNTVMMLLNTLYFESEWETPYVSTTDGEFTDLDGSKHPIKKMYSTEQEYYDLGNADAFKKPYKGGNYSFVGILPHEDVSFDEFIENLDGVAVSVKLKAPEELGRTELEVMIPQFKYTYEKSLNDILIEIGIKQAFDKNNADFSRINDLSVEGAKPLYIDDVLHKTKIEVTKKGTKAAATSAVFMGYGAAPYERKVINIFLDRPFVYMIVDKNNVPLFIGTATMIER